MPIDSLLLAIAVCIMFLTFAVVLAWADRSTTRWLRERAVADKAAVPVKHRREAA